jgi:hypothetical protein
MTAHSSQEETLAGGVPNVPQLAFRKTVFTYYKVPVIADSSVIHAFSLKKKEPKS